MNKSKKGIGIIFHSDSFDRIHHGLTIALAGLALGRETNLFFTYGSLEYLRKGHGAVVKLDNASKAQKELIMKNIKRGHLHSIVELVAQSKLLGAKLYVCTSSMGVQNVARDELIEEVDKCMGMITFLTENESYQILFI